jgi:hypothetical protein
VTRERDQDPMLPRRDVARALQELPRLYVAAYANLPAGSHRSGVGAGRWTPPIPINDTVHDTIQQVEWAALQHAGRLRLILGYTQPWGRMNDACPYCGCWSLFHNAERGLIRCNNPECVTPDSRRPLWRGRAGWLELAALLTAAEPIIDQGETA